MAFVPSTPAECLESWTSALQRLSAFQCGGDSAETSVAALEAATLVEAAAELAATRPVPVPADFMALCVELLEERLPVASRATRAVLSLLANLCLSDETRAMASDFGLPSTCLLLLQRHQELSAESLFCVMDLMASMAAGDGRARQSLRPSIPYVLAAMRAHPTAPALLFGGSFLLSTLALLDAANCDLVVCGGGLQVLVGAFIQAEGMLRGGRGGGRAPHGSGGSPTTTAAAALQAQSLAERAHLCEQAKRWSRDTLGKVCRGATAEADVAAALAALDFGRFGVSVAVDDFKWSLLTDYKRHQRAPAAHAC